MIAIGPLGYKRLSTYIDFLPKKLKMALTHTYFTSHHSVKAYLLQDRQYFNNKSPIVKIIVTCVHCFVQFSSCYYEIYSFLAPPPPPFFSQEHIADFFVTLYAPFSSLFLFIYLFYFIFFFFGGGGGGVLRNNVDAGMSWNCLE